MVRKFSIFVALVATMILVGSSIALATEPNFGGEGNFSSGDVCGGAQQVNLVDLQVNEDGWRILTVSGTHHQGFYRVDASGNAVTGELDTILPAGTYLVAPDVLGTGWTYAVGCNPTDMVNAHIARRVADPTVNTQGMLVLPDEYPQVYDLFVPVDEAPVASGADFGSTTDTVMAPEPETVLADPVSVDMSVVLARAYNDDRNPFDQIAKGDCQILAEYFGLDDEFATSGSHGIIAYPDELGQMRVTLTPHMRAATGGPIDATVRTLDVNCSFDDALVEVQRFLQENSLTTAALIDWKETGLFSEISRKAPYFGVGNGNSNEARCKAGLGREGLIQKHGARFGEPDAYVRLQAWANGYGEHEFWLAPGEYANRANGVKGWYWTFDARYCSLAEIRADANGSHDRRVQDEANNVGVFPDWKSNSLLRSWFDPAN